MQWRSINKLRKQHEALIKTQTKTEQAQADSERRLDRAVQGKVKDASLQDEVVRLRAKVHALSEEASPPTNRTIPAPLDSEQVALALTGGGQLPRRVVPPAGPLPRQPEQYRIQLRYTGLTAVLQKQNADGTYTDILQGSFEKLRWGERYLLVRSMPTLDNILGGWAIIDLETGQLFDRNGDGNPYLDDIDELPEAKMARSLVRYPHAANEERWTMLFE